MALEAEACLLFVSFMGVGRPSVRLTNLRDQQSATV